MQIINSSIVRYQVLLYIIFVVTYYYEKRSSKFQNVLSKFIKEITAAKAAKDNFMAALTHEIRNPLNSVLGSLEIIEAQVQGLPKSSIELIKNA